MYFIHIPKNGANLKYGLFYSQDDAKTALRQAGWEWISDEDDSRWFLEGADYGEATIQGFDPKMNSPFNLPRC